MNIRILWFDNDPKRTLEEKIQRAAKYYQQKYGSVPTSCHINPTCLPADEEMIIGGITVRPDRTVLPDYFWIGRETTTMA